MGAMGYVVAFLERTRAPLLANLYPYFVYTLGLGHMDMSFALFTSPETVVQDGEYGYQNLLEASVDALYTAVGKLGGSRVRVVVSEIGWPTAGGAAASVENAMTYNQNLVRHVWKGTPRRPRRREPQGRRRGAELGALLSKHGEGLPDHLRRLTSVDGLDTYIADFVVYLGDLVTANNLPIPNASLYWDRAVSAARGRGIPWAAVFGNHDDMPFEWPPEWFSPDGVPPLRCPLTPSMASSGEDQGCSCRGTPRIDLMTTEIGNNRLSYSSNGPKDLWPGVSNYVLQVLSHTHGDPALLMYFLDSGGGSYTEVISSAQVKWFQSQSQFLNPNGRIPELIFWHIPSTAYVKVAPEAKTEIRKPCVGSINKEDVAPQAAEWGMMDALAKRPSVKAIFVGHNHGLDWCCPYEKMWLCFARHTGYGGYGNWPKGARIIQITENPFSTVSWIRMENGTKHSDVTLSS